MFLQVVCRTILKYLSSRINSPIKNIDILVILGTFEFINNRNKVQSNYCYTIYDDK